MPFPQGRNPSNMAKGVGGGCFVELSSHQASCYITLSATPKIGDKNQQFIASKGVLLQKLVGLSLGFPRMVGFRLVSF